MYIGQKVRRADHVPPNPTHTRNAGIGGQAAVHLSINRAYPIKAILPNGGLILEGFLLPVSPKHVVPADTCGECGGLRTEAHHACMDAAASRG
jgi:hypothetical protein